MLLPTTKDTWAAISLTGMANWVFVVLTAFPEMDIGWPGKTSPIRFTVNVISMRLIAVPPLCQELYHANKAQPRVHTCDKFAPFAFFGLRTCGRPQAAGAAGPGRLFFDGAVRALQPRRRHCPAPFS